MIGSQEPRIDICPKWVTTDGPDTAELYGAYGNKLFKWQEKVEDEWLAKDKSGNYIVVSAGLPLPRQNGKNVCLEAREFYGMAINGERILHTAHQVKTAKKSFHRLESLFTDPEHEEIKNLVKHISHVNGEESIELTNGGRIEFSARSRQSARGFDGISLVVFDEAQELTDDQLEAVMSTLAASTTGTRQLIYTGTPPYPGCPGTVFRRIRESAINNPGPHDSWMEWSVEGKTIDDIDINDRSLWYMTNPSLGLLLSEEFTMNECKTMSPDGFARERLGWWPPITSDDVQAIPAELWDSCASIEKKPEGKVSYGVKFSVDGSIVALCGSVMPEEGPARISLIEEKNTNRGLQWLADWLNKRSKTAACVVIDGKNGVDVLIDKINDTWKAKGSIVRASAKDVIAADSELLNELTEKKVTWYKPQTELRDSATTCIRRKIGGGWGFGGDNSVPIEAAALALWGVRTTKRDPKRKMRIG